MFSSISIRFTIDEYESCVQYIFFYYSLLVYRNYWYFNYDSTIQTNIYYFLQQQIAIIRIVRDFTGIKLILNITLFMHDWQITKYKKIVEQKERLRYGFVSKTTHATTIRTECTPR